MREQNGYPGRIGPLALRARARPVSARRRGGERRRIAAAPHRGARARAARDAVLEQPRRTAGPEAGDRLRGGRREHAAPGEVGVERDAGAGARHRAPVRGLVEREQRQHRERHAVRERAERRAVAAVADDRGGAGDSVLRDPVLDVDVRRQLAQLGEVARSPVVTSSRIGSGASAAIAAR